MSDAAPSSSSPHEDLVTLAEVLRQHDPAEYYVQAAFWFRRLLGADHAAILLLGADGVARFEADTGLSEAYREAVEGHFPWEPDDLHARAFRVEDVTREPSLARFRDLFVREGIGSLTFVPLRGRTRLVGKVMAYYRSPGAARAADLRLAEAYGEHIAIAISGLRAVQVSEREAILQQILVRDHRLTTLEPLARRLLEIVLGYPGLGIEGGGVYLLEGTGETVCVVKSGADGGGTERHALAEAEGCPLRRAIDRGEPVVTDSIPPAHYRVGLHAEGDRHAIFPLVGHHGSVGALHLHLRSPRPLSSAAVANLTAIATAIGHTLERFQLQEALVAQAASFRTLLDHAPITAAVHRGGQLVYANHAMAASLGYSDPAELTGTPIIDLVHRDDRERVAERIRTMAASGRPVPQVEVRFLHRSGSTVFANVTAVPVVFEGEPSYFVLAQDITEKRALQAQSIVQDRLAALGQLAAMVGHDINNPLSYVTTNLEFIKERLGDAPPDVLEALADAAHGARVIGQITSDLRSYVRSGEAVQGVRLRDVVGFVTRMSSAQFREKAELSVDVDPAITVQGRPVRLAQVLMNLVSNAVQASGERAEVEIHARREGERVVVEVRDRGEGMSPEAVDLAFRPFVSGKAEGTGLGLYISKSIVTEMGGSIGIESALGEGTTVRLSLPAGEPRASREAPAESAAPEAIERLPTLVLVDDDLSVLRSMKRLLSSSFEVIPLHGGELALQRLEGLDRPVDAILCDVMMPGISGPELYRRLERAGRHDLTRRFCFMSGGVYSPEVCEYLRTCPAPVARKPVDVSRILSLLDSAPPGAERGGRGGRAAPGGRAPR